MRTSRILSLGCACALPLLSFAQGEPELQPERDFELWVSAAVETKPFSSSSRTAETAFRKKFRTMLETGYRSNENLGNGKTFYTTLGLRYKVNDWLRTGIDNRYSVRDSRSINSYRIDLQASLSKEVGRMDLGWRITWQHEFIPVFRVRDFLRNRASVGYRIKDFPLDPEVSVETFTALYYKGNYYAGIRYDIGTSIDVGKGQRLDLTLRHDREIGVAEPLYRTIIVVAYEIFLDR